MAGMQQADLLQERPETERSKYAMKCYHCDCELTDQDTCPTCGADVALYKKLMSLSNLYYNEGFNGWRQQPPYRTYGFTLDVTF